MNADPIFRSVGQALYIAYAIEGQPATHRGSTQVLIEGLKQQLGKVERRIASSINTEGLNPLEFRGQCAMVRAAVEHLPNPESAAIMAWYGRHLDSKARGVKAFRDYIRPQVSFDNDNALLALSWNVFQRVSSTRRGERLSYRAIEQETGISKSTLDRAARSMITTAIALRSRAEDRLHERFAHDGLIASVDTV